MSYTLEIYPLVASEGQINNWGKGILPAQLLGIEMDILTPCAIMRRCPILYLVQESL